MPYADKEKQLEYLKNWRLENQGYIGRWFKANKLKMKQYHSVWWRNNRKAYATRRKLREQIGSHTQEQWSQLKAKYGNRCLMCGLEERLVKDHIKPLWLGGTNDISNIQPLCSKCNFKKSNSIIDYRKQETICQNPN